MDYQSRRHYSTAKSTEITYFNHDPHGGTTLGNTLQAKGCEEEEASLSHNLYLSNVSSETRNPMLMENFIKFGEIESIAVY